MTLLCITGGQREREGRPLFFLLARQTIALPPPPPPIVKLHFIKKPFFPSSSFFLSFFFNMMIIPLAIFLLLCPIVHHHQSLWGRIFGDSFGGTILRPALSASLRRAECNGDTRDSPRFISGPLQLILHRRWCPGCWAPACGTHTEFCFLSYLAGGRAVEWLFPHSTHGRRARQATRERERTTRGQGSLFITPTARRGEIAKTAKAGSRYFSARYTWRGVFDIMGSVSIISFLLSLWFLIYPLGRVMSRTATRRKKGEDAQPSVMGDSQWMSVSTRAKRKEKKKRKRARGTLSCSCYSLSLSLILSSTPLVSLSLI